MPGGHPSIGDLVGAAAPTFSFEFFPPRDADGERQLWQAIRELESLRPSFVSITYGAGGSTRDNTVAVTEHRVRYPALRPQVPGWCRLRHHSDVLRRRGLPAAARPGDGGRLRHPDRCGNHARDQHAYDRALVPAVRSAVPGIPGRAVRAHR